MILKRNPAFLPGLMFVIAMHGALLYFLLKQQFISPPKQLETLMVNFIPAARPKEEPKPEPPVPPKSQPVKKPPTPSTRSGNAGCTRKRPGCTTPRA